LKHRLLGHSASWDAHVDPDLAMDCCGDVPTIETLATVCILREYLKQQENDESELEKS
jgi:phosphoketolase